MPSIVLTSIQLGLPPFLVFALVVHTVAPAAEGKPVRSPLPVVAEIGRLVFEVGEEPHTDSQTGAPTPRAADVEWETSTSLPSRPLFTLEDGTTGMIMRRVALRRDGRGLKIVNLLVPLAARSSTSTSA